MEEYTSPEVLRPMKQLGDIVAIDPYDSDVPADEEAMFEEGLNRIDSATSWDY